MRTVPLHGKKAAGRVALVDDEDYELVKQYKWRVYERAASARYRAAGPYAITTASVGDGHKTVSMHGLIVGQRGIDHEDHNGLNNQRSNLRPANQSQNSRNQRPQVGRTSQYKGVFLAKKSGLWRAVIRYDGRQHRLGDFASELEAAYAYDAAAREHFGEFACPNFQDEPTAVMRDQWLKEAEIRHVAVMADGSRRTGTAVAEMWMQRPAETRICTVCEKEYQSRSMRSSLYCPECRRAAKIQCAREWRAARRAG